MRRKKCDVAIIMGSDSDYRVMKAAVETLKNFSVTHAVEVVSAHRTPERMLTFAQEAEEKGYKVIIAGAGGAAHLPGMVASATNLPVIGVPVKLKTLSGLDSLLSVAQMPKGVPVATMAVDNSTNAALLAARILAVSDEKIKAKLNKHTRAMKTKVKDANKKLKKEVMKA